MSITVQHIIQSLIAPVGPLNPTVDTLKTGQPHTDVKRVAVVFMATYDVIQQAVAAGAELIITHEPTFYNHLDETEWLQGNPVYEQKKKLIEEAGVAIFRLHDYIHKYKPDGILIGMLQKLGWEACSSPEQMNLLTPPADSPQTVRTIAHHLKDKLGIDRLLVVGDPEQPVDRFGLLPGASGGRAHINYFKKHDVDLLIVGETNEWETNEFVRDAAEMGLRKALIVTGHQKSEEAGMLTVVTHLREAFPELDVMFIAPATAGQFI
ncbi:Nif3-like dinuclear metal center hexameric protein [Paenibacillus ferrarius]|uniref:Nif3-like dinuclear metal center hexameric protein n=1 Tax=Paenibacillus ferrarius TaxID=1469647 RepID=UPI003D27C688